MSSEINAYSAWLGIPEDEQPPHYYRLLGLEPFENDPDAIRQAGQRVLGIVKLKEKGPQASAARRLKAEITFAASCLLDQKKKSHYDRELEAWFNEFEAESGGNGDEYELEEPDLPMAKIVPTGSSKSGLKSKRTSGKSKSGIKGATGSSKGKADRAKSKGAKTEAAPVKRAPLNTKLIAAIAAMVVGVLGLGGALGYVFLKPATVEVANQDDKANTANPLPEEEEEEEEGSSTKATADSEEEEEEGEEKAGGEKENTGNKAETTEEQQAEPGAGEKKDAAVDAAGAEKSPDSKEPTPPAGGTTPTAVPGDKEAPTTDPAKENPMKADPAKTDPKKEEPKKEEPKKEEPKDPFQDVDVALDLPDFVDAQTSTSQVVLAKVYPKEGDFVNAILMGGEFVLGKQGKFALSGGILGEKEPKWTITYENETGAKAPIAELAFKGEELSFAWNGQGTPEINNVLKNCKLKVTAGYSNRSLPLRMPVIIEPLQVVMDSKGTQLELPVVGMPEDLDTVTLEITKLLGGFPNDPTYDPGQQIKADETTSIMFAKVDLAFRAKLEKVRGGGLTLDFRPMIRGEKKGNAPRPLKPYILKKSFDQMIQELQANLNIGTANYEAFKKKFASNKDALAQGELQFQQASNAINDQIKQLTDLKTNIDTLTAEGKVQFRVFMSIGPEGSVGPDTYTLDLLKTKDYSPPPEPEKKPEAKKKK